MRASVSSQQAIRRIVERSDLERLTDSVLSSFAERDEFQPYRPLQGDLHLWVRWNLDIVMRWLMDGQPPAEGELDRLRDLARACASGGIPADVILANYRQAARFAWSSLLDAATDEERTALLDGAGLLFDFVDSVSRAFSDAYDQATRAGAPSPDERAAQGLLVRLERNETHLPEDYQLAGRIGFDLAGPWRPFLVTMPGRSPSDHSRLARRLRDQRVLAASAGRRVTAAALERPHWRELDDGPNSIIAESGLVPAEEFGAALGNLRALVEVAAESGLTGPVNLDDHLAEVLLHRSPTIAARLSARVFGPLDADDAELARTLESLIEHDFDRGRTAAALPVHRNTLTNRLHRIRSMTGVDVDRADGTALVWLAWLERCRDGSGSRTAARPPT
ncbi:MAG: PucR family transcriptional regulator [Acidimicrobiales bacterium]